MSLGACCTAENAAVERLAMAYVQTTAYETADALTVCIFREEDTGAIEAKLLPLPGRLVSRLHRHSLFTSTVYETASDVPAALGHANSLQSSVPDVESILVQLGEGIEWDAAWGELIRTDQR